jgi:hypothetical protein
MTNDAKTAIALFVAVLIGSASVAAQENAPEVTIVATIDRSGDFMGFGFDSLCHRARD